MQEYINRLSNNLNLTSYQSNRLRTHYERYNIARLEKRGGVLYAPYAVRGVWQNLRRILFGRTADLIGRDRILLRAQRNIKFCANGCHSVRVGRYVYYANACGQILTRDEFVRETKSI